jgi:hypothetical protein
MIAVITMKPNAIKSPGNMPAMNSCGTEVWVRKP